MFNNIFESTKTSGTVKRNYGYWTDNEISHWTVTKSCNGQFCYHDPYRTYTAIYNDNYSRTGALYNYTDGDWSKYAWHTITRTGILDMFKYLVNLTLTLNTSRYDHTDWGIANLRDNWQVQFWGGDCV